MLCGDMLCCYVNMLCAALVETFVDMVVSLVAMAIASPPCLFNDLYILLLGTNLTVTNSCISLPVRIFSIGHCTANFSYNNTKYVQGRSVLSTLSLAHFSVMIEQQ